MTRRLLVVLIGLFVVASACSLGPKEDWAKSMRDADEAAARMHAANVRIYVETKVVETTIRNTPVPLFTSMAGVVDFAHKAGKVVARAPKGREGATMMFADLVSFIQRSKASLENNSSSKHWARFNFESKPKPDIDANDRRLAIGSPFSPVLAVELLQGVLAGSVKRVGTTTDQGSQLTQYDARLAPDAAVRDLRDEERHNGILRMFETFGVNQDIFPVKVWMDGKGVARRIVFTLRQEKDRVNIFATTIDFRFENYGTSWQAKFPKKRDTLTSRRYENFVGEYIRELV